MLDIFFTHYISGKDLINYQGAKQICQLLRDEELTLVLRARYSIRWFTLTALFISHNNFPTEGLLFHSGEAEARLWEGQEVAQVLVRFGGRVGIQTPIFLTLTSLTFLLQVKIWPKCGFKHLFPILFWSRRGRQGHVRNLSWQDVWKCSLWFLSLQLAWRPSLRGLDGLGEASIWFLPQTHLWLGNNHEHPSSRT